ncbi:hypothetical protein, partial [Bacillus thuringiensis]|uniref:hypothetical protein n=1 Tax=Bacillus thuringiensis TaxID=1428 RepID=UPI001CA58AAC
RREFLADGAGYTKSESGSFRIAGRWSWIQLKVEAPYNWALLLYIVPRSHTPSSISLNISAIFQIYRPQLRLYRRLF